MMSHRFELNLQAIKEFERVAGCEVDFEQAAYRADQRANKAHVVVASVQTLNSRSKGMLRMERFHPEEFGLLMIDEAHRSAAASYRRVVEYFRKGNSDIRVIGVTATPDRLDRVGLGCVFDKVSCDLNIRWGIENGWLVAPRQVFVRINGLDLSEVKTVGGDLDKVQLAKVVEVESTLHEMAAPIVDICGTDKQSIVFTASVQQAHRLAELIRDYTARKFGSCDVDRARSIDGTLNPQDPRRRQIVADFKAGKIQHLINMGVATEGFDAPGVRVVAIGRPTKSRALYTQMLGRGTRPIPGTVDGLATASERMAAIESSVKPYCTVIDFMGQAGRHSLVCSTDVLFGDEPAEIVDRIKKLSESKFDGDQLKALEQAKEEARLAAEARRKRVTVGVNYEVIEAGSKYDMALIPKVNCPGYLMRKGPSEKQRAFMMKLGFTGPQIDSMNVREASAAIDYAIANPRTSFARWFSRMKQKEQSV